MTVSTWFAEQRWIEFLNSGSTTIPAYGLLEVHDGQIGGGAGGGVIIRAREPTKTGGQIDAVNSPRPVPAGKRGLMSLDFPTFVKFSTSDIPLGAADPNALRGSNWGTEAGQCTARAGAGTGLRMLAVTDFTDGIAFMGRAEHIVEGQLNGTLTAGGSVLGKVFTRLGGSWADAGWTVQITDKAGWDGEADYYFMAQLINNQWRPIVISCDAI